MNIHGIGTDICDTARITKIIDEQGDRFLKKVFTEREINYCRPKKNAAECFAARFAAKEAVLKALGTGMRDGYKWKDIEVLNDELGKPYFKFSGKCAQELDDRRVLLSISHAANMAIAFVIIT